MKKVWEKVNDQHVLHVTTATCRGYPVYFRLLPDWPAGVLLLQPLQLAAARRQFVETADSLQQTDCLEILQLRLTAEGKQKVMLPEEMVAAHQELKIGGKCTSFRGVEEHQTGNVFPALTGPVEKYVFPRSYEFCLAGALWVKQVNSTESTLPNPQMYLKARTDQPNIKN